MSTKRKELRKKQKAAEAAAKANAPKHEIDFPTLTDAQVAFSTLDTNERWLEMAKERGFDKSSNPYNQLFSELFFKGGKINFKPGLDEAYKTRASRYLKALASSFTPRHEHKEAVCALILSQIAEV